MSETKKSAIICTIHCAFCTWKRSSRSTVSPSQRSTFTYWKESPVDKSALIENGLAPANLCASVTSMCLKLFRQKELQTHLTGSNDGGSARCAKCYRRSSTWKLVLLRKRFNLRHVFQKCQRIQGSSRMRLGWPLPRQVHISKLVLCELRSWANHFGPCRIAGWKCQGQLE